MDSTSSQPNMRHPSFPGPWPPCPRYPPRPCGFPIDHRFYPPPMPPFQRPHFQCPPSSNQLNPRLFPEMNVFHHPYQMPGIFPPRPPDLQNNGTHHILHQAGSMPSGMPPYGPQHQPRGNFSRVSDSRVYSEGHGDPANHQMYCHYPNLPVKSESNNDYNNLKSSITSHSQLPINPKKDNHSIHELMTDKTSIHQEQQQLNTNYEHASHFIQTKEYYNEPYKHSESKRREGLSSSKDYERCKKKSSHKRSVTSDRKRSSRSPEISKDDRKKLSKPSDERKRKEDPSHIRKTCKSSNRKEKCRNSSEEKEQSIGHSHERTRNCSKERRRRRSSSREKKSRNPSNEQRQSRNPNSERKQSRNHSLDRRKSRNNSKEKRHSKNYSSERKSIKNRSSERMHSRNRGSECKKTKNLNAEGKNLKDPAKEKRTVHNDEESSKTKIKTAKNDNCEKGNSNNEGEILKATNLKRESSDVNYENKTIQLGNESKKLRTESNEKRKLNSSERENIGKTIKKSSKCHKHSSHTQKKRHCPHSDQLHHRKCRSKAHDRQVTNDHKLEKEDNHSIVKSMETGKETSDIDEVNPSTNVCTWIRSSPAELYYIRDENNPKVMTASHKLIELHQNFDSELVKRAERVKLSKPKYEPPHRKTKLRKPKPPKLENEESSSTSEESSSEEEDTSLEELERKKKHPYRLHEELWYNDPGEMNDGPLCRCSAKARRSGIRHGIYAGESSISLCDLYGNNADKLHHYRIEITPTTNFLSKTPTTIHHDGHDFRFEGFSILSHFEIPELPNCKVIRFNIEYTIYYVKEKFPENFTIAGLELFSRYLFTEVLELVDLNWKAHDDSRGCPRFHFLPRFARDIEANGKELLSLNVILQYLLDSNQLLIESQNLPHIMSLSKHRWQDLADNVKGMIVTCPGMKPSSIRVDQLDRELCDPKENICPEIVHFGVRPPQLSYAGNPNYQKAWRDYVKFRHLLANKPKVIYADRHRLLHKERRLQEMRMKNNLKRDVTVVISSEKFYKTGIMCDVVQHGMLLPVLICHLRFHQSLDVLEDRIGYKFKDRYLLQLALTHPSYRENFGTNPDHARNSLTNCGIRQPEYGDRRIHYMNTRKRGINTLINIMSRFGRREETASRINHNERLEFLGDAVVEFLSSIHLFFMFSNLEEGGLATYRAAIVQNQHLAVLAKNLQLEKFMLYAHGSDLCHDLELRHAMANCFEALMGALFLDGGIDVADRVFSETLFSGIYLEEWANYPSHPLQELEPRGDRKWIPLVPILQNLSKFEESTGIEFTHIRLLARAMTHRSLGYNNLTMGSNQRLEFLGDTVLQLVASEYLYKYFPEHHEGHLSLLRSSLVNNRTQAVVCDDLGMVEYAIYPYSKVELKAKDRADLLEAFLGALYVDKGLGYCTKFCEVCFFPRLQDFIMNQEWNDPKSKLQQCCLTLRTMDGGEPDIPVYKVIECKGPTNTRVYSVAVYFRRRRLAVGTGHSIQQAEMSAAENALYTSKDLFPQLDHQRRAIEKSLNQRKPSKREYRK